MKKLEGKIVIWGDKKFYSIVHQSLSVFLIGQDFEGDG